PRRADPAHPRVSLQVPVQSLGPGIPLMDAVMRGDRWLAAAKPPTIRLTLSRVTVPAGRTPLADGKTLRVQGEGTLELRGASTTVPIPAEVTGPAKDEGPQ